MERDLSRVFFTKTFAVIYEFIFFNFLIKDRQTSVKLNYPFEISPPSERRYRVLLKPRKSLKIRQFIHVKAL